MSEDLSGDTVTRTDKRSRRSVVRERRDRNWNMFIEDHLFFSPPVSE